MANSDKNIVITPNVGSSSDDPKIVFSGGAASEGPYNITMRMYPFGGGTLSFEGVGGQLLSLNSNFTGTIFSANDLSGIPSIEVLDNGLVKLAQYAGNVTIGTGVDNSNDKLQVNGSILGTSIKGSQLISTANTGTSPLVVTSTTMVNNLNAQYWNGNAFSSYLNQGVRTGDSPTFSDTYTNGWFRNNNANQGLYNQSTGGHLYTHAAQIWNVAGNTDGSTISLRWVSTHNGTVRGQLRGDGEWFGFMNRNDEFALRHRQTDGYSPNWWFLENGNETWTGDTGADEGKIEYHANRFYMVAGTNSDRIVQFRRGGSDKSYIDNDGVFIGNVSGNLSGNASTAYGLSVHTGRNNEANKVVRTDGSGYAQFGWINTDSGNHGTTTPDRIYASNDGYIRYYTPENFLTVMKISTFAKALVLAG